MRCNTRCKILFMCFWEAMIVFVLNTRIKTKKGDRSPNLVRVTVVSNLKLSYTCTSLLSFFTYLFFFTFSFDFSRLYIKHLSYSMHIPTWVPLTVISITMKHLIDEFSRRLRGNCATPCGVKLQIQ